MPKRGNEEKSYLIPGFGNESQNIVESKTPHRGIV
jgi:hypothetical protein